MSVPPRILGIDPGLQITGYGVVEPGPQRPVVREAAGRKGDGMIRLLGSAKRLCDGLTRRDWLHLGGLALFGVGLSDFLNQFTSGF